MKRESFAVLYGAMGAGHSPSRHELCPRDNKNSLQYKLTCGGKRGFGYLEEEEAELAEGDLKRLWDPVVANYWPLPSNSLDAFQGELRTSLV